MPEPKDRWKGGEIKISWKVGHLHPSKARTLYDLSWTYLPFKIIAFLTDLLLLCVFHLNTFRTVSINCSACRCTQALRTLTMWLWCIVLFYNTYLSILETGLYKVDSNWPKIGHGTLWVVMLETPEFGALHFKMMIIVIHLLCQWF